MTYRIVPAAAWRRLRWGTPALIGPTDEWWVHHGAVGAPTLATLRAYERYHVANNGWLALGYNFAIGYEHDAAQIYEARGWHRAGAHTSGRNTRSHAVLLIGDWTSKRVPDEMVKALVWLTREGHRVGALRRPRISGGHLQAPGQNTRCPGAGGLDAVNRARILLSAPANIEEDVMSPAQEAKLDRAITLCEAVLDKIGDRPEGSPTVLGDLGRLRRGQRGLLEDAGVEVVDEP